MDTRRTRTYHSVGNKRSLTMMDKLLILAAVLVIVVLAFFSYLLWGNIASEITVEAGSVLDADLFLVMDWGMTARFDEDAPTVDMSRIGDNIVKVRYHGVDFYPTLHVVDTHAPVVTVQDATVYSTTVPNPEVFIQQVQDGTPVTVTYVKEPDMSVEGTQEVQLCCTDSGGNSVFTTSKMNIVPDYEGPRILGVNKVSAYAGSTLSFENGVVVQDNCDPSPTITIDSSRVNLNTAGTYEVIYRATDAAGNMTTLSNTVTVVERPETYVEETVITDLADDILYDLIKREMSTLEKVEAVYDWIKDNCSYANYSDKTDRLQAAYAMMTEGSGDGFSYYAICSLFFDRLEIPYICVVRSDDSVRTSSHYWCLVSVDNGETYYHFDACPQTGFDVRICLVTDAALKSCNEFADGYYTFDEEYYPATPED